MNFTPYVNLIVADWLRTNGYDGLLNDSAECACKHEDIAPCGYINGEDCLAGYLRSPTEEEAADGNEWMIDVDKPKEKP